MAVSVGYLLLTGLFFILLAIAIVGGIVWFFYSRNSSNPAQCTSDDDCGTLETCNSDGYCDATCKIPSDCRDGQSCIRGFCRAKSCVTSNDCDDSINEVCSENICVIPSSCSKSGDCFGNLVCDNGECVECLENRDCVGSNLICSNGACIFPQSVDDCETVEVYIGTGNNALNNNPSMPTGYCCPSGCGGSCSDNQQAPDDCPYCVGGTFRCTQGQTFETCAGNGDCASGNCISVGNGKKVCAEGSDCVYNYTGPDTPSDSGYCTKNIPYCIGGICQATSTGAWCAGSVNNPTGEICFFIEGNESNSKTAGGGFCVNNRCQDQPGDFNDICVTYNDLDSCMIASVDDKTGAKTAYKCKNIGNVSRCLA